MSIKGSKYVLCEGCFSLKKEFIEFDDYLISHIIDNKKENFKPNFGYKKKTV